MFLSRVSQQGHSRSVFIRSCRLLNLTFSLLAANSMTNPDDESTFFVAAWMTISNLVAVGYTGSIGPNSFATFALGIMQQLQGILLQAFLFSVAVTRFQMPQADLILSDNLLFTNRFYVPHLIFRIGNLRCNMIFNRTSIESVAAFTVALTPFPPGPWFCSRAPF